MHKQIMWVIFGVILSICILTSYSNAAAQTAWGSENAQIGGNANNNEGVIGSGTQYNNDGVIGSGTQYNGDYIADGAFGSEANAYAGAIGIGVGGGAEVDVDNTNQQQQGQLQGQLQGQIQGQIGINYNDNSDRNFNQDVNCNTDINVVDIKQKFESPRQFHVPQITLYGQGPERNDEAMPKGTVQPVETYVGIYTIDEIRHMAHNGAGWAHVEISESIKTAKAEKPAVEEIGAYQRVPMDREYYVFGTIYVRASGDDVLGSHCFARAMWEAAKLGATGVILDETNRWNDMSSWSIGLGGNGSIAKMSSKGEESTVGGGGSGFSYAQSNYKERPFIRVRPFGVK